MSVRRHHLIALPPTDVFTISRSCNEQGGISKGTHAATHTLLLIPGGKQRAFDLAFTFTFPSHATVIQAHGGDTSDWNSLKGDSQAFEKQLETLEGSVRKMQHVRLETAVSLLRAPSAT